MQPAFAGPEMQPALGLRGCLEMQPALEPAFGPEMQPASRFGATLR